MALRRRDNRNDPVLEDVVADAAISARLDAQRRREFHRVQDAVGEAIQQTDGRKLKGWVAVVVWEDADGNEEYRLICDDHSTPLELKGYLHDGVWAAAHVDG